MSSSRLQGIVQSVNTAVALLASFPLYELLVGPQGICRRPKGYAAAHSWAPYEGLDQRLALDTWPSVRAGTAWPFPPAVVGHQAALRWPFPVESAGRFERAAAFFVDAGGVSGV